MTEGGREKIYGEKGAGEEEIESESRDCESTQRDAHDFFVHCETRKGERGRKVNKEKRRSEDLLFHIL